MFTPDSKRAKRLPIRRVVPLLPTLLLLFGWLFPSTIFAWGAGMHATLTAHAHERMSKPWKDALDRGLLMHGSFGPDVWYILSDEFMSYLCPVACGSDDGRISNECWGRYEDPDRTFAYTRHLLASAKSLQAASWAFGYGAHAVEDWRGHMEYIIPDGENPEGNLYNRHTFIDSTGAALIFNLEGLHGYPSRFTPDPLMYGYADAGFLTTDGAEPSGERNPDLGLAVVVEDGSQGRQVRWSGVMREAATGLSGEAVADMADEAGLGSASEGILAALYGRSDYDALGHAYPIVVADGSVAIDCGTDYRQRIESEEGYFYSMPCQVNLGAVSGLAQWDSYLKPAAESGEDIVVNGEKVAFWMDAIAKEYTHGGVRLDDRAVFGIDEETGLSTKHLYGVDGRDFTFGRSMSEIVDEVLELNVQDVITRLFENGHIIGTLLQSPLSPLDKARFVLPGFAYRPRLSAWPESLPYRSENVNLLPEAPGPFARFELAVDMQSMDSNAAPERIFPYYLATLRLPRGDGYGRGRLHASIGYKNREGNWLSEPQRTAVEFPAFTVTTPADFLHVTEENGIRTLRVRLDNSDGGYYVHHPDPTEAALVLELELEVTDTAEPPFDWLFEAVLETYCHAPDLSAPGLASDDNSACPLEAPDFPDEADGDGETPATTDGDNDVNENDGGSAASGGGSGCRTTDAASSPIALAGLLLAALMRRRRTLSR